MGIKNLRNLVVNRGPWRLTTSNARYFRVHTVCHKSFVATLGELSAGTSRPFDLLAEQFSIIAACYKDAKSVDQRKQLLAIMRLIIDEADSLHAIYTDRHFNLA